MLSQRPVLSPKIPGTDLLTKPPELPSRVWKPQPSKRQDQAVKFMLDYMYQTDSSVSEPQCSWSDEASRPGSNEDPAVLKPAIPSLEVVILIAIAVTVFINTIVITSAIILSIAISMVFIAISGIALFIMVVIMNIVDVTVALRMNTMPITISINTILCLSIL